jgi:hypothetical protein
MAVILIPYRRLATIFLLVVTVFIATPVEIWHHHNKVCLNNILDKTQIAISESYNASLEGKCLICSHQYSSFTDDAFTSDIHAMSDAVMNNGHYGISALYTCVFLSSNKGPPVTS